MLKQILHAALIVFAMVGSSWAQPAERPNEVPMPPVIESPQEQIDEVSGINYKVSSITEFRPAPASIHVFLELDKEPRDPGGIHEFDTQPPAAKSSSLNSRPITPSLLTDIVNWLSTNYELPAIQDHPSVELVPAMKLAGMRYKSVLPDRWRDDSIHDPAVQAAHQREVVAVYNDTTKTIFLSDAWTGTTPAELSVLVHEMVHHLQNLAKLKYECPAAREKLAYQAQDGWLKLSGGDLEKDFEIDMLTLLVTSACMN